MIRLGIKVKQKHREQSIRLRKGILKTIFLGANYHCFIMFKTVII